jgi:hypothetical protein
MFITGDNPPFAKPPLQGTLWHCEKCYSLISIYSTNIGQQLVCPVCLSELEFCVAFDGAFGQAYSDA